MGLGIIGGAVSISEWVERAQ